jgi:amidase
MAHQEDAAWQDLARQVQSRRDSSIAELGLNPSSVPPISSGRAITVPRQHLSASEIAITESSAHSLLASLAEGKLTAIEVTKAFLKRAAIAQKLVSQSLNPRMALELARRSRRSNTMTNSRTM